MAMGNNPINGVDPDGAFFIVDDFLIGGIRGLYNGEGFFKSASENVLNSFKIWGGLFQGSGKQILSRFTKELPQTIGGLISAHTFNNHKDVNVTYNKDFGGATFITNQYEYKLSNGVRVEEFTNRSVWGGFTLNSFILGDYDFKPEVGNYWAMHEYGHYLQSQDIGLSYLHKIGIPSALGKKHTEHDTNTRANIYFYKNHGFKWNPNYFDKYQIQYSRLNPGVSPV